MLVGVGLDVGKVPVDDPGLRIEEVQLEAGGRAAAVDRDVQHPRARGDDVRRLDIERLLGQIGVSGEARGGSPRAEALAELTRGEPGQVVGGEEAVASARIDANAPSSTITRDRRAPAGEPAHAVRLAELGGGVAADGGRRGVVSVRGRDRRDVPAPPGRALRGCGRRCGAAGIGLLVSVVVQADRGDDIVRDRARHRRRANRRVLGGRRSGAAEPVDRAGERGADHRRWSLQRHVVGGRPGDVKAVCPGPSLDSVGLGPRRSEPLNEGRRCQVMTEQTRARFRDGLRKRQLARRRDPGQVQPERHLHSGAAGPSSVSYWVHEGTGLGSVTRPAAVGPLAANAACAASAAASADPAGTGSASAPSGGQPTRHGRQRRLT